MKLNSALLCFNCDELFEGKKTDKTKIVGDADIVRCPSCGSSAFMPLTRWIMAMDAQNKEGSPAETEAALKG